MPGDIVVVLESIKNAISSTSLAVAVENDGVVAALPALEELADTTDELSSGAVVLAPVI